MENSTISGIILYGKFPLTIDSYWKNGVQFSKIPWIAIENGICVMEISTISLAIFNSKLLNYQMVTHNS